MVIIEIRENTSCRGINQILILKMREKMKIPQGVLFNLLPKIRDIKYIFRVKNWAMRFGVDLWEFGKQVTKITEIKRVRKRNIVFF